MQTPRAIPDTKQKQELAPTSRRRFAKTLRLTSDQLVGCFHPHLPLPRFKLSRQKALDLKAGANNITFSLSASGVIACTARIFVWDSTDLVLISDIDGTITKYVKLDVAITSLDTDTILQV